MKRLLLFTIALFTITQLEAQGWGQTQKIVPTDRGVGDYFGWSVAMNDDFAVIGAYRDAAPSSFMGSVHIYKKDLNGNWIERQKLTAPDKRQNDQFGYSVDIHGDYLIIGTPIQSYDENNTNFMGAAGAAYIYEKDTNDNWNFMQKLVASDRESLNTFGHAVAINGNTAIVSPVRHDFDATGNNFIDDAGAVYIFERDGNGIWNEVQKIVASDREALDYFGQEALAVSGNTIIVGSLGDEEDENNTNTLGSSGSAYIFERDGTGTWNEIQKIVASDREAADLFGRTVGIDGNYLVVGADGEDENGNEAGAAYVFERNGSGTWNEIQKLTASNGVTSDRFGRDLDIDGNRIIIGARLRDLGNALNIGAAYIFENQAGIWSETSFIYDAFYNPAEYFGWSVAISGDYALSGTYQEEYDENEENELAAAGAAFIFNVNEPNTLSVAENNFKNTITAYPNPVINTLNLDFGQYYTKVDITINNIIGQQVFFKSYQNRKFIELPFNMLTGIYLVKVKMDDKTTSVLKIVKQ